MEELIVTHLKYLLVIANNYSNLCNPADLVNTVVIKMLENKHRFDGKNFKAWAGIIIRNEAISYNKVASRFIFTDELQEGATNIQNLELFKEVMAHFQKEKSLKLTLLYEYATGYKYKELSAKYNIPINTIKGYIRQARISLKEHFKINSYDYR